METSPKRMFFMYAFPALASCSNVDENKISELEKLLISGGSPSWEELEELVPCAIKRTSVMAEREGLDPRSFEAVKMYWWADHNRMIDAGEEGYGDLPSHISDVCKTSFVEVLDFNGDKIVYHLNGTEKTAFTYFKDLEVGDFVTIHVNRVVEKISEEDFREYSRK